MIEVSKSVSRNPMIHNHLTERTHRCLKIIVTQRTTTIQQLFNYLILREAGG